MNTTKMLKKFFPVLALALSIPAVAGNVNIADARSTASKFLNQCSSSTFRSAAKVKAGDLVLAHAEASQAVADAHDYYAFNVPAGGWVVVAGDDRAKQVLAYSDTGCLDFAQLPCNFKALLEGYKNEIEFLQKYTGDDLVPAPTNTRNKGAVVSPLIASTWGQEEPYDLQCPVYNNEYCVVGCVATAMAQVMLYWKYPESSNAISSYYCYSIHSTVGALPATTFNYSLMLNSYCHWDYENKVLVQDTYTEAQAQEAAKLSRYCGQAVEMDYSPEGSGAYTWDQLYAMHDFGFTDASEKTRSSYWGSGYTNAQWESMIKTELDAGRPILYSASDTYGAGGHAFICDGYDDNGMFHFNLGWYGTCDGWYTSTALNMTHRDGEQLYFNSGHEMIIGIKPPEGWEPPTYLPVGDINGDNIVDINDVNILINIVMELDSASNYPGDANVDGQGEIDIDDINMVINIILEN